MIRLLSGPVRDTNGNRSPGRADQEPGLGRGDEILPPSRALTGRVAIGSRSALGTALGRDLSLSSAFQCEKRFRIVPLEVATFFGTAGFTRHSTHDYFVAWPVCLSHC